VPGTRNAESSRQSLDSAPVLRGRRAALAVVVALLLAVGVVLLIARAAGFSEVRDAIAEADSRWFLVCLAAQVVALAGCAVVVRESVRWRGGPEPGFGLSAHVVLATIGATRVFAAAGAGALAVAYWCFRRAGFETREALVRVLGFNTLFYLVLGIGAWAAALAAVLGVAGEAPLGLTTPWLLAVPSCIAAAALVTQPGRVERLTRSGGSMVRRGFAAAIGGTAWVRDVISSPQGRRALAGATLYWVGNLVCLWAALRSVDQSLATSDLVLAFATGQVAMILPLPFGGVGGVDAAMTYAFTAVGLPLAPALVAVAVYRLFAFWAPTIPGLVALALLSRAGRGLERAAEAPA
jgi:uncharacterized membrane protein YbhN (UPF0104 family)